MQLTDTRHSNTEKVLLRPPLHKVSAQTSYTLTQLHFRKAT